MPTVTLPSPSTRAHSWDLLNFRSPGISLILGSGGGVVWTGNLRVVASLDLRLAFAHERELHHPHRYLAAADVHPHAGVGAGRDVAGRDARERDRLAQRRREGAGQDLAVAVRGDHALAVPQHALLVHHQADHLARVALGLLPLEHLAADEVAALVERHGPAERRFVRGHRLVHVL